jgi:hypothetical protein
MAIYTLTTAQLRGRILNSFAIPSSGGSVDPDAQAFITAAGITDPTQQSAINTLVVDLKANNIWTKMRAIYPFVGGTATTHKWNLKDPRDLDAAFRLLFSGGWTHSANGIQGNGVNNIANTIFVPSTQFSASPFSVHYSAYSRTSVGLLPETTYVDIGSMTKISLYDDTSQGDGILYKVSVINDNNSGDPFIFTPLSGSTDPNFPDLGLNTLGLFTVSSTSNSSLSLYRNSTQIGNNTFTVTNNLPTTQLRIGAFSNKQYAFTTIGTGFTSTDTSNLYTAVQTFQTSLSRQV